MAISMYSALVPPLMHSLQALSAILGKAQAHCEARKIDPAAFLNARLYPDMLPFIKQVQIACDTAKGAASRLAGTEAPSHPDTETSLAELQARIQKTLDHLVSFKPEQIDGSEGRAIVMKFPNSTLEFVGQQYLSGFVLPNFYFHVTTAYALLRHGGVELGKRDYLGG
jgi:hypothetical protein